MKPGDIGTVNLEVPPEIVEAARKVQVWAIANNVQHWQIGGVCALSYALTIEACVPKLLPMSRDQILDPTLIREHNLARQYLMAMVARKETGNLKGN